MISSRALGSVARAVFTPSKQVDKLSLVFRESCRFGGTLIQGAHVENLTHHTQRVNFTEPATSCAIPGRSRLGTMLLLAAFAIAACNDPAPEPEPSSPPNAPAASVVTSPRETDDGSPSKSDAKLKEAQTRFESAKRAIDEALAAPALPGAPEFEKHRAQLVARAKSEPVFFLRRPGADPDASKGVAAQRLRFERTDFAWRSMRDLKRQFKRKKDVLRQLFLSEGYVFSDSPNHAFTLVSQLRPGVLFDDETLWIQRGSQTFHAKLDGEGDYVYTDGPQVNKRVRLLHLDRVGTGPIPEPLHVDFRELRYRHFFDRAKVRRITQEKIVADLRYGELWVPTLLGREGATLSVEHEQIAPADVETFESAKDLLRRKSRVHSKLREAMRAAIDEGLPFDEPKTEFGQEDGKLRRLWRHAYLNGRTRYKFNDDRYSVFGKEGQPLVPQVCIDYMVDTFQRASGSWYRPKQDGVRERTRGKLDFGDVGVDNLRRTQFFVNLAKERTDWFDVRSFPENDRVELGYKDRFFDWLLKNVDEFDAADIILIRGMTPWDEIDEHTHSFFIYETDPMTGIPIAIAGNAGPANLWSWETEARRTPHRTVRTRIRARLDWLESFVDMPQDYEPELPALISGKK